MDDHCPKCDGEWKIGQFITRENPKAANYGLFWTFDVSDNFFNRHKDLHNVMGVTCASCGYIEFYRREKHERPSLMRSLFG